MSRNTVKLSSENIVLHQSNCRCMTFFYCLRMDKIKFDEIDDGFWSEDEDHNTETIAMDCLSREDKAENTTTVMSKVASSDSLSPLSLSHSANAPAENSHRNRREHSVDDLLNQFSTRVLGGHHVNRDESPNPANVDVGRKLKKDFGTRAADTMTQAFVSVIQHYYNPPLVQDYPRNTENVSRRKPRNRKLNTPEKQLQLLGSVDTAAGHLFESFRPSRFLRNHALSVSDTEVACRQQQNHRRRKLPIKSVQKYVFRTSFIVLSSDEDETAESETHSTILNANRTIVCTNINVPSGILFPLPKPLHVKLRCSSVPQSVPTLLSLSQSLVPLHTNQPQPEPNLLHLFLSTTGIPALRREEQYKRSLIQNEEMNLFYDTLSERTMWCDYLVKNADEFVHNHRPKFLLQDYYLQRAIASDFMYGPPLGLGENSFGFRCGKHPSSQMVIHRPQCKYEVIELMLNHLQELLARSIFSVPFSFVIPFRSLGCPPPLLSLLHPLFNPGAKFSLLREDKDSQRILNRLLHFSPQKESSSAHAGQVTPLRLRPSGGLCSIILVAEQQILRRYSSDEVTARSLVKDSVLSDRSQGVKEYYRWEPHSVEPFREIPIRSTTDSSYSFQFDFMQEIAKEKIDFPAENSGRDADSCPVPKWLPTLSAFDVNSTCAPHRANLLHELNSISYHMRDKKNEPHSQTSHGSDTGLYHRDDNWMCSDVYLRRLQDFSDKYNDEERSRLDTQQIMSRDHRNSFYNLVENIIGREVDLVWIPFLGIFSSGFTQSELDLYFQNVFSQKSPPRMTPNFIALACLLPRYYQAQILHNRLPGGLKLFRERADSSPDDVVSADETKENKVLSSFSIAARLITGRSSLHSGKNDEIHRKKIHDDSLKNDKSVKTAKLTDQQSSNGRRPEISNEKTSSKKTMNAMLPKETQLTQKDFLSEMSPKSKPYQHNPSVNNEKSSAEIKYVDGCPRSKELLKGYWHRGPWCFGRSRADHEPKRTHPIGRSRWPTASEEKAMVQKSFNIAYQHLVKQQTSAHPTQPNGDSETPFFSLSHLSETFSWYKEQTNWDKKCKGTTSDSISSKINNGDITVRRRLWARLVINPAAVDDMVVLREGQVAKMHTLLRNLNLEKENIQKFFTDSQFMQWWSSGF